MPIKGRGFAGDP